MRRTATLIALFSAVLLLTAARRRSITPPNNTLDFRRSIIVTEVDLLDDTFSLKRVFTTLIERSGAQLTPLQLYRQMFDTQNPKPGLAAANTNGSAPHCDDFITDGKPSFNGFPRRCPTPEGALAITDPFTAHEYKPIGLVNRFDKAPQDGANCGEYRMIYARVAGGERGSALRMIIEGVLPNPHPEQGLAGCRPAVQFWANLSAVDSIDERRARLEQFFFTGIPGFAPVIHPDHYGKFGGGIRTFQLTPSFNNFARFYQFRVQTDCSKSPCTMLMVPDVLENLPFGPLFSGKTNSDTAKQFRADFIRQVQTLATPHVNYFDDIPKQYLMVESDPVDEFPAFGADVEFSTGQTTADGKDFAAAIGAELKRIGSPLQPIDVIVRTDTQNCAGCHLGGAPVGGGMTFPHGGNVASHVNEEIETGQDLVRRYAISPALRDVFAPDRARVMTNYLMTGTIPVHSN
jgi:hypothetical protein